MSDRGEYRAKTDAVVNRGRDAERCEPWPGDTLGVSFACGCGGIFQWSKIRDGLPLALRPDEGGRLEAMLKEYIEAVASARMCPNCKAGR